MVIMMLIVLNRSGGGGGEGKGRGSPLMKFDSSHSLAGSGQHKGMRLLSLLPVAILAQALLSREWPLQLDFNSGP